MRVLLACSLGGSGHLTPVVNVARAVGRVGHDAVVLVPPSLVTEIERASLDPSPWPDSRRFRPPAAANRRALPDWWPDDDRPLVYLTFGSVIGHLPEATAVYRSALDAVAELPARVLLTVGRAMDAACLGEIPENTHVESWIPQHEVLDHAAVVACHGGSGTVFGALAAGVPLVICPLFADQSANGRLIESAHAGRVVAGRSLAPGSLRGLGPDDVAPLQHAIERVLDEPRYRQAANRIAAELAITPTLDNVVESLLNRAR
jgi:MGT family glycosyltransferase